MDFLCRAISLQQRACRAVLESLSPFLGDGHPLATSRKNGFEGSVERMTTSQSLESGLGQPSQDQCGLFARTGCCCPGSLGTAFVQGGVGYSKLTGGAQLNLLVQGPYINKAWDL